MFLRAIRTDQIVCGVCSMLTCTYTVTQKEYRPVETNTCIQPDVTFICYPSKESYRYEACFGRPSPKMVSPIHSGEYYLLFVAGDCLGGRVLAWHKEGFDFLLVSLAPPEKKQGDSALWLRTCYW